MTDTSDETLARVEQGLDALFAAEVVEEILSAVDVEAILAEEAAEDPVDVEQLAAALGRPLGKFLATRILGGGGASGVAKQAIGSEVGGRTVARALEVAVERVDLEAAATELAAVDASAPTASLERVVDAALDGDGSSAVDTPETGTDIDVTGPGDEVGDDADR